MSTTQSRERQDEARDETLVYNARPNLLNWTACVLAGLGPWLYGYDSGIISSIISPEYTQFYAYFNPSDAMTGTIVAIIYAGAVLGGFGMGLADRWGRQKTIIYYSIISIIAVNLAMMIVGRLLAGFAMGALTSLATLYQAEISPSHVRGMMTASTKFVNNWGFFSANWIGYGCQPLTTSAQWRVPLAIQIVPPLILFIGMFFVPESPRFLLSVGRTEEARTVLFKLRSKKANLARAIEAELEEMKIQIDWEHENLTSRWVDLVNTSPNLRRTMVAVMVQGMAVFNGIVVINYYAPTIYTSLGFSGQKVLLINGLWGLCGPIASFIYMIYGGELLVPQFVDPNYHNEGTGGAGIAAMFLFGFTFNSSFGPIAWLYQIEIFPMNLRAKGAGVATAATWLATLILLQIAPIAFNNIGWKYFLVFIVFNITNSILCYFFCPETAGRTLEEIGVLFGDANVQVVHVDGVAVRQDVKPGDDIELQEHADDLKARETV
ncbi:hypothetical protein EHS25_003919 [Saitozyma podzolica]|uniref:Major facilitator superfamily (MFS) profile domain-containing protein n=1 Tax=Saitozyma podzolica TaxID=1890683 RepID=A0A427Y3X0_9TREE|nr:hypothetical protein EHS25_003919 [Saitozyma podzolica]